MKEILKKYNLEIDAENIEKELIAIREKAKANFSAENLKIALGAIDLTSLHTSDTPEFIEKFTDKVNKFKAQYPQYPLPASICVYPNFAKTVKATLKEEGVGITTVSACFPSSQSFLDVKELETRHDNEKEILDALSENRNNLRNRIRRSRPNQRQELQDELDEINLLVKEARKNVRICERIQKRTEDMARRKNVISSLNESEERKRLLGNIEQSFE